MTHPNASTTGTLMKAASIVNPIGANDAFPGTIAEAADVMVAYAQVIRNRDGDNAQTVITRHLVNSQPERVAEMCAAVLLRLAAVPDSQALAEARAELAVARAQIAEDWEQIRAQSREHCPCCTRARRTEEI